MSNLLTLTNLSKSFGSLKVIEDFSMNLNDGEALGIIGPNGAGKSTLFNLITGSLRSDKGTIIFEGNDLTGMPAHVRCRAGIGRSYQIPHPFGGMTVFENLLVGAAFGGGKKEVESYGNCIELLERTGLIRKANILAGSLTLLERKRLEMARALATKPKVLLLDEIVERGAVITANRVLAVTRKMFKFAVGRDIIDASPCVQIPAPSKENRRERRWGEY